jgi:CubicO group peptidase (beta-lactamase class C family)
MKILLVCATSLFLATIALSQTTEGELKTFKMQIDSLLQSSEFNGVVLLAQDSSLIYKKAFGFSDLEQKTPLSTEDLFVIGSISKQITAALVLREYEKGNIQLEATIDQFLPKIDQNWAKEVTIHQLLTHTHGILALNEPLEFEAGSQFHYSQLGYHLLAQILEKVTKKQFSELSSELFEELQLNNTYHPANQNYHLVKGYEQQDNGQFIFSKYSLENYVAAGSFISNVDDLCRWNMLLHAGKIVNSQTLQLMKSRYATRNHPIFEQVEYGYGLLFKDGEADIQIGALGYAPGFVSATYYYPQSKLNLVVLENTARELSNFKKTFQIHTKLMEISKKWIEND